MPVLSLAAALFLACGGIAICAPRLLVFAPNRPASVADAQPRTLTDSQIDFRGSALVPAAFHPAQKRLMLHNADIERPTAPGHRFVQSAVAHKSLPPITPLASRRVTRAVGQHPDRACVVLVIDFSQQVNPEQPVQVQGVQLVEQRSGFHEDFVRILILTQVPNGTQSGSISQI